AQRPWSGTARHAAIKPGYSQTSRLSPVESGNAIGGATADPTRAVTGRPRWHGRRRPPPSLSEIVRRGLHVERIGHAVARRALDAEWNRKSAGCGLRSDLDPVILMEAAADRR